MFVKFFLICEKKICWTEFMGYLSDRVLVMETNEIPMTQMMLDIFLEDMSNIIEENDIPREYVIFAVGEFLNEYESRSLMLATERLLRDLNMYQTITKPFFELTLEEIDALPSDEKDRMKTLVQMGLIHSLMMETIIDLTRPLAGI